MLNDLPLNPMVFRVLEIAKYGSHSITLIGNEAAVITTKEAKRAGINARTISPCPCGNAFGSVVPCTCSVRRLQQWWRAKKRQLTNELIVNVADDAYQGNKAKMSTYPSCVRPLVYDKQALDLLDIATHRLPLTWPQVERIKSIASTIAAMGRDSMVKAPHIAEALQYRAKS